MSSYPIRRPVRVTSWRGLALVFLAAVAGAFAQAPAFTSISAPRQVVNLGGNLTLAGVATAASSYQWKRNGRPIAGATAASHTLAGAQPVRDNGWYQLVATNATGSTTSAVVFVGVAPLVSQIVGWGQNIFGQLQVPSDLGRVLAVSAGENITVALKFGGTVSVWGSFNAISVAPPSDLTGVVAISAGFGHVLALKSDGTVVGWGNNSHGQATPPAGLNSVVAISAGGAVSAALKADGTVTVWGSNEYGQQNMPAGLASVVAVSACLTHLIALKADGSVSA